MFDQLLLLPSWVLAAVGATIGALIGLALAAPFRQSRPGMARYLPLAVALVGYAAADRFLVPAIADLGLAHCAIARDVASQINERYAGTQPDISTSFTTASADCDTKVLSSAYTVAQMTKANVDPAGLKSVETAFTADTCGNPTLRRLIARGWRIEAVYEFGAGEPLVLTVEC